MGAVAGASAEMSGTPSVLRRRLLGLPASVGRVVRSRVMASQWSSPLALSADDLIPGRAERFSLPYGPDGSLGLADALSIGSGLFSLGRHAHKHSAQAERSHKSPDL
jgi:hypothetical protein